MRGTTMKLGAWMVMGLAACGGDEAAGGEKGAPGDSAVAAAPPPATPAPAPSTPAAAGPRLTSRTSPQHGAYLADGNGRALYLLEAAEGGTECYDACLGVWPPLFGSASVTVTADSGVSQQRIGTAQRRDGTSIVTYGGHPLYYYAGDRRPGDTQGQHVEDSWGEWYLLRPDGGKVEDHGGGRRGRGRDDR